MIDYHLLKITVNHLKTLIVIAITLGSVILFPLAVLAADACETVLCLYGKMAGNSGGNECQSAEQAFFNIVKKNRHSFLPHQTSDARKAFLLECKSADPDVVSQIISKFGRLRR